MHPRLRCLLAVLPILLLLAHAALPAAPSLSKPAHLRTDELSTPLGLDDPAPAFSWQLADPRTGARQSAYQIQVATSVAALSSGKPDVWDSGRIASAQSVGVLYSGPALVPSTRYFWRVLLWDQDSHAYPPSDAAWWETGLLATSWQADWISAESVEHRALRESSAQWISFPGDSSYKPGPESRHAFRYSFSLSEPARHATLYLTGKDAPAAWLNGDQVLSAAPLPPWKQTPWQTYQSVDVTSQLRAGTNRLAVEITRFYTPNSWSVSDESKTPMSACLVVQTDDGSELVFQSDPSWKSALNPPSGWTSADFDDSSWRASILYPFGTSPLNGDVIGKPLPSEPVKLLRSGFTLSKPVRSARLYATALGSYEFHLNGAPVGNEFLSPGWTDYRLRIPYQVFDVTRQLHPGPNAIGAYLASGWYATPLTWLQKGYNYGDTPPALRAQLRVEYADGSVEWISTGTSWKVSDSPILSAEIYNGETLDARRTQPGWDNSPFNDASWKNAAVVHPAAAPIVAQSFPPVRIEKLLDARALTTPRPGVAIYDFGQNLAGVARIRVSGPAGATVRLRFAEVLNPDGTLYTDNLRTAEATDRFILSGKGVEEFQPRFTFHGFRYLELTGLLTAPDRSSVKAVVLHTDAPFTMQFQSGVPMINQLFSNILWGQRSNFISVPTDCPQRDERLGWTADAQVFWRTASFNMDLAAFSRKFSADIRGTQNDAGMFGIFAPGTATTTSEFAAGWSDAGVIIPWTAWSQYGDLRVLEQNWPAMDRYVGAIEAANPDFLWKKNSGIPYGDWLAPDEHTSQELLSTALWAYDASLMRQMARALHHDADETRYAALFASIKAAFNKAYVRSDGFVGALDSTAGPAPAADSAHDTPKVAVDTQTAYVLALAMDLLPAELRSAAADRLVAKIAARHNTLGTGFLGTPSLLAVLADTGHAGLAYQLLLNTQFPSWGYMIERGATTMWERWNGDQMFGDPGMNSFNHYAYGAVGAWLYRYAAGIDFDPDDPGFHSIYLHPNFDARLGSLDATYASAYGPIRSAWKVAAGEVSWDVTLPPNTNVLIAFPVSDPAAIRESGKPLAANHAFSFLRSQGGIQFFTAAPGAFHFTLPLAAP